MAESFVNSLTRAAGIVTTITGGSIGVTTNKITGISTAGIGVSDLVGGLTADNVNVTGVLTATSIYGAAQIGVASEGTYIGTGASVINFASSNGTAWTVTEASAGVVTATVTPGASLGLAIALGG